jgi:plasmid stability protein
MIRKPQFTIVTHDIQHPDGTVSKRTIAFGAFMGRTVRATATCHPDDEYDAAFGEALAIARCNEKIAHKRLARAQFKSDEARAILRAAIEYVESMNEREAAAEDYFNEASAELNELLVQTLDAEN